MNYVFTFIGEFGYELFNWQGVIRKWAKSNKKSNDKIIICSRKGLENIYDFADYYFNISELDSYNNTVADCYKAYIWEEKKDLPFDDWPIIGSGPKYNTLINQIKGDIKEYIKHVNVGKKVKWVWSCDYIQMDGFHFSWGFGVLGLNLNNNEYNKIKILNYENILNSLQEKINIDLSQPFILCQTGYRAGKGYTEKSKVKIDHKKIFNFLSNKYPILCLNFNTGRYWDSASSFENKFTTYKCSNFNEQSVLISQAKLCIFTTEGDFRSHTYIPPLLGKDVHVIASNEVLKLPSSSNVFWNKNIFTFGGQMYTHSYENFNEKTII